MKHCSDNSGDRRIGRDWEERFCELVAQRGRSFTTHQIDKSGAALAISIDMEREKRRTLPDVSVWTFPTEHHEIKHKSPTKEGHFGLEVYRFDALRWFWLETGNDVMYTIHRHDWNGGRNVERNRIEDWVTISIAKMDQLINRGAAVRRFSPSWVNGSRKDNVPMWYWHANLWAPLAHYWNRHESN